MIDPAPTVSVVISMRDMAETVGAAVRSIICQTLTEWELILIDDGSRDDGAARVAAFGDARIRIIRHEASRGMTCCRNEAARLARGEFIAVMDADDICYPERLTVQVAMLRSDPAIDLVASQIIVFRRQGEVINFLATPPTHEQITANPYRGFPFPHPTWCGRAAWFRERPYDERISRTADHDLLLRAMASSRFAAADEVLLGYRKEHFALSKRLREWLLYSYAVWRHAWRVRDRRRAARQIAANAFRLARMTAIVVLGGEERWVRRRIPLLNPEVLARWPAVWSTMSGTGEAGGLTHDTISALAPAIPIVSVIMSMRDMAATVEAAVRSIICQTLTGWELILIDDGSRDDSAVRAAAFGDPRIRIIRHERSKGLACRINEAVRFARGEFIARMDADDVSYPERLAVQVNLLRSDPTIDLLGSNILLFRRQGEVFGFIPVPTTHEQIVAHPYFGFVFPHVTWCGRAAWFRKNPYDERLWRAEDGDLLLRTAATSRFAATDRILVGVRRERISLSKRLRGTLYYSFATSLHAWKTRNRRHAATAIKARLAALAADAVAIGRGRGEWVLTRGLPPLSNPEELARWRAVWTAVSDNMPAESQRG